MSDDTDFELTMRRHIARNAELIDRLAKRSVDLNLPRAIEHHFWAENHRRGVELANELYRLGFILLVLARVKTDDETRDLWNVEAERQQSINEAVSEETVSALIALTARFQCIYDGWGTRI